MEEEKFVGERKNLFGGGKICLEEAKFVGERKNLFWHISPKLIEWRHN